MGTYEQVEHAMPWKHGEMTEVHTKRTEAQGEPQRLCLETATP